MKTIPISFLPTALVVCVFATSLALGEESGFADGFNAAYAKYRENLLSDSPGTATDAEIVLARLARTASFVVETTPVFIRENDFKPKNRSERYRFVEGNEFALEAKSPKKGWFHLFWRSLKEDGTAEFVLLYPRSEKDVEDRDSFECSSFTVGAPFGWETGIALVSTREIPFDRLAGDLGIDLSKIEKERDFDEATIDAETFDAFLRGLETEQESGTMKLGFGRADVGVFPKLERREISSDERPARTFFVGVSACLYRYGKGKELKPLTRFGKSVEAVKASLIDRGDLEPEDALVLADEDATLERVRFLFESYLPERTRAGDSIVVYWLGHGFRNEEISRDPTKRGARFALYDSLPADMRGATVAAEDVYDWTTNLSGRRVLCFLDSCGSGAAIDTTLPWKDSNASAKGVRGSNLGIVAACSPDESALADLSRDGFSFMASAMVDVLERPEPTEVRALAREIEERVRVACEKQYGKKFNQNVLFAFNFEKDEFVFESETNDKGDSNQ